MIGEIVPVFRATIKGSGIELDNPQLFGRWCRSIPNGAIVEVTVARLRKPVSTNQYGYLYDVVYALISQETGNSIEVVDDSMKARFLTSFDRKGNLWVHSKTELNTATMETYLDNIRQWASMALGLYIPLPNEVTIR